MAVYFSTLTLWIYFLLYRQEDEREPHSEKRQHQHMTVAILDGDETRETSAFLQLNRGTPRLRDMPFKEGGDIWLRGEVDTLSTSGMVLDIARRVLRDNFPVSSEPLPPLVESLSNLLGDLESSGPAGE